LAQMAVAALVGSVVWAGSAGASQRAHPARHGASAGAAPRLVVSPNWSGYVAVAPLKSSYGDPYFTSATGTWTVPAAHCTRGKERASSSTVWVGLGGYATRNQEEVGTDSNCSASGKPLYYAWFELVPYLAYRTFPDIQETVSSGDTITGLVRILSATLVELRVEDRTRGWTFLRRISFSSEDTSTADWVVEAPADCVGTSCHQANLTDFGAVTMRDISAVGKGSTGTLTDPRWKVARVRLVPGKLLVPTILPGPNSASASTPIRRGRALSPAGATPGAPSANGTSFKLRWIPAPSRGL
jgi:hypothetical protein